MFTRTQKIGTALKGRDVMAALTIVRTLQKLTPQEGQSFLTLTWLEWRAGENKNVSEGIATFFDLYFAFHGDFNRIAETLLKSIPPAVKAMAEMAAEEFSDENVKRARSGPICDVGFAAQLSPIDARRIPAMLEDIAASIRKDIAAQPEIQT